MVRFCRIFTIYLTTTVMVYQGLTSSEIVQNLILLFNIYVAAPTSFKVIITCRCSRSLQLGHLMTKPTKWHVHPAKTDQPGQIRVFAVCMKKASVLSYPLSAQRRLWSDWADVQADLSLCWAYRLFCLFCHEAAHFWSNASAFMFKCFACSPRKSNYEVH